MPYYQQYLYWIIASFGARATYYVAWCINDGSIAISGLSYAGDDEKGNPQFNKIQCVDVFGLEFATVPRDCIKHWNSMTAEWLRHYVYERIRPEKGNTATATATLTTNLVSAFWHGFYPIYYPTFINLALLAEIGKDVYRLKHIFGVIPYPISSILSNILIVAVCNYTATGMIYLEMAKSYDVFAKHYFFIHIGLIVSFVTLRFIMLPMFGKRKSKEKSE
jgi:lysophospholipid acyltransferase